MTKEHKYFDYYCLDRLKSIDDELPVSYKDDGMIRKIYYKKGLQAKVKNTPCFILYTEDDFENLIYASCDYINEHMEQLLLYPQEKEDLFSEIKQIQTINIFEFTSMLNFMYIYSNFKDIVDYNWENLGMDSLIEAV